MNTEMCYELTSDELDGVAGGVSQETKDQARAASVAVAATVPVLGGLYIVGLAIGDAIFKK